MIPSEIIFYESPEEIQEREKINAEVTAASVKQELEADLKTSEGARNLGIPFLVMRELEELREFKRRETIRSYEQDSRIRNLESSYRENVRYIPGCCQ